MVVLERRIASYSVSQTKSSILWRVFGEQCSIRVDAGLVTYATKQRQRTRKGGGQAITVDSASLSAG